MTDARARVVVIDSGIDPQHPGVRGRGAVCAGPWFDDSGVREVDGGLRDQLGHGSAVAATILRHAPHAELIAVRVFDDVAGCEFGRVLQALAWALAPERAADLVNLSLGTTSPQWQAALAALVSLAGARGVRLVAPAAIEGVPAWPGSLPGVDAVIADANVPELLPTLRDVDGRRFWFASPRDTAATWTKAAGASLATAHVVGALASAVRA